MDNCVKVFVLSDGQELQNNICSSLKEMDVEISDVISESVDEKNLRL